MSVSFDVKSFYARAGRLLDHYLGRKDKVYGGADCLCIARDKISEENPYLKSTIAHLYLFGYELPDTLVLFLPTRKIIVLTTAKKVAFLQSIVDSRPEGADTPEVILMTKNKADANKENFENIAKKGDLKEGTILATFVKEKKSATAGGFCESFYNFLDAQKVNLADLSPGISAVMAQKDEKEADLMKKSSVLTKKVFKSFRSKMEDYVNDEENITHEKFAGEVAELIEDPSKLGLKIDGSDSEQCFFPIIQSGGEYDLKVNAQSSSSSLSHDIVIASIGARYQSYCSSMSRTYLIDPCKKVETTYQTLVDMQVEILSKMVPGKPLNIVSQTAEAFLVKAGREDLVAALPKRLGFAIGLDFRDPNYVLDAKATTVFREGMVFCLNLGFQGVELTEEDKTDVSVKAASKKLSSFGLLVGDTVKIVGNDVGTGAEVLTVLTKALDDINYQINDKAEDSDSDVSDVEDSNKTEADGSAGGRKSSRLKELAEENQETIDDAAERAGKQDRLIKRRNEKRLQEIAKKKNRGQKEEEEEAEEFEVYKKPEDLPESTMPNQVKVDMINECIIVPINGNPVPFHVTMIKNVVQPEPDKATYLRINFHTGGGTITKDVPANVAKLIQRHNPFATFVREMTFRSLERNNLDQAYRQIMELRKRVKQREQKEQEESNLVEQTKLKRTKQGKIPRLQDLTMRPQFSGRKTNGQLEAHTNGLRFRSQKSEVLDIMYDNVRHAFFQPCKKELMVLVHFNLKNPIMIGRKKHDNVQFYTEVIDSSEQVDGSRRSMYDPDEFDEENRQLQLRKRLNEAFKVFCKKVERVAVENNFSLEFDVPYRQLGFNGTPNKEMVLIQPTLHCLVNLTETPFFVAVLDHVDHVHFERVTFSSKTFDVVFVNKDFTKQPWRIDMIQNSDKDSIQTWLCDMELPYTEGTMNLNWKQIMAQVVTDDRFYMDTEEDDVTAKEAGWEFLRMGDEEEDEGQDDDESAYSSEESDVSEEPSDDEDGSSFAEESEEESDFDGDEELEEEGMDWDEMEEKARKDDKRRNREQAESEQRESAKRRRKN